MTNKFSHRASVELVKSDPSTALKHLAVEVDHLHRDMHPGAVLTFRDGAETIMMGRHEVPALARLFRLWQTSPECREAAVKRAIAYVTTASVHS